MAGSLNKVCLVGNLGKDPESRRFDSGGMVVNFTLATTDTWTDKTTNERKNKTEWHNVVVYNESLANVISQYCKKGSKIYIEGQLQTREYTDKDGQQRRITEVVLQKFRGELILLDSKRDSENSYLPDSSSSSYGGSSGGSGNRKQSEKAPALMDGDDIPF